MCIQFYVLFKIDVLLELSSYVSNINQEKYTLKYEYFYDNKVA